MDYGFGVDVPETLAEFCRPERLALVVYDMQVGIVRQLPDGAEVTRAVGEVLEAARAGGFRVFFTRHMSLPNEVAGVVQLRAAKAWQRARTVAEVKPSFPRDSPSSRSSLSSRRGRARRSSTRSPCPPSSGPRSSSRCATAGSSPSRSRGSPSRWASSPPFGTRPTSASCPSWWPTRAALATARPRNGPSPASPSRATRS